MSQWQLVRWVLARQGLLARCEEVALGSFGPLHATDQTTPFLSLLARIKGFDWSKLKTECSGLSGDLSDSFVRLRCMRGTLHLIPAQDASIIQQTYTLQADKSLCQISGAAFHDPQVQKIGKDVLQTLKSEGPLAACKLRDVLKEKKYSECPFKAYDSPRYSKLPRCMVSKFLDCMANRGVVQYGAGVPKTIKKTTKAKVPQRDWRTNNRNWTTGLHKDEEPKFNATPLSDEEVMEIHVDLARYYFGFYGPASYKDFVWWTGLTQQHIKPAFAKLVEKDELRKINIPGLPDLFLLATSYEEYQSTSSEPVEMCRLLPYEDALIKSYKETRHRFWGFDVNSKIDALVVPKGVAVPSVWIDGEIIGSWSWKTKAAQPLTIELHKKVSMSQKERLLSEAAHVKDFIEASGVEISYVEGEGDE